MSTCDTCRWWKRDVEECTHPFLDVDNEKGQHLNTVDPCDTGLLASSNGNVPGGNIYTGPKFGCIHHEPK